MSDTKEPSLVYSDTYAPKHVMDGSQKRESGAGGPPVGDGSYGLGVPCRNCGTPQVANSTHPDGFTLYRCPNAACYLSV